MLCKTEDLADDALDYAVLKGLGDELAALNLVYPDQAKGFPRISPSSIWAQGGPLLFDYQINVHPIKLDGMDATKCWKEGCAEAPFIGENPLVAGMRCLVNHFYGPVVDIPEVILQRPGKTRIQSVAPSVRQP